jgi:hypothetical protein
MRVLYAALFVLFLLHNDLWLWNDTRIVAGLPVGLLYHVVYCLVTSAVLWLLVTRGWPYGVSDGPRGSSGGSREGASPSPTADSRASVGEGLASSLAVESDTHRKGDGSS